MHDRGDHRVAVVVVAHNGGTDLLDCVASVVAQEGIDRDVIVVDNASSDDSIAQLERRYGSAVHVVRRATNDGYGTAANAGRRATNARWIVVLNQDLTLERDCLRILVDAIRQWPTTALGSPLLRLRSSPEVVNAIGNDVHWSGVAWCHGAGTPVSTWSGTIEVAAISGAAFAMHADLFDELEGLDERFFMYMEDVDLSLRARARGYACIVACEARGVHDWRLALSPEKFARLEANRRAVWERHLSGSWRRALLLLQAEAMGWAYAARRGPAHVRAKLLARRRRPRIQERPNGWPRFWPWLSTRHPYEVLFPGNPSLYWIGGFVDRIVARLAGVARTR